MPKSEEMKCMCTSFQGAFDMGMSMMNFPCMGKKVSSFGEQACSHNPYFIDHLFWRWQNFLCDPICIFLSSYFLDNTDACLPLLPQ
jgi:hypothetical protein